MEIGDKAALDGLVEALTERDWHVREAVAKALARIGGTRAVEALVEALKGDPVGWVRESAAWALGEIGDRRAEKALKAVLEDKEVKWTAFWALRKISQSQG